MLSVILPVFSFASELRTDKLNELLLSPDNKVRLAAVKFLGKLSSTSFSHVYKKIQESLSDRCKDYDTTIYIMQVLSRMWSLGYNDLSVPISFETNISAFGQSVPIETWLWIPSALVETMYTDDQDSMKTLYEVLYTILVPLSVSDDILQSRQLMLFSGQLNQRSKTAFQTLPFVRGNIMNMSLGIMRVWNISFVGFGSILWLFFV
jgi:hypothetical protein